MTYRKNEFYKKFIGVVITDAQCVIIAVLQVESFPYIAEAYAVIPVVGCGCRLMATVLTPEVYRLHLIINSEAYNNI